MRVYIDSDILIWHLRGDKDAGMLLKSLIDDEDSELWIGAMQRAEILFFMREEAGVNTIIVLFSMQE